MLTISIVWGLHVDTRMRTTGLINAVKGQDQAAEKYKSKGITASVEADTASG